MESHLRIKHKKRMAKERGGKVENEEHQDMQHNSRVPLLAQLVSGSYSEGKTKKSLTHEEGVGSPCAKCNFCEGLDLHFWRKVCKNCGCKFEDHDVKVEESVHEAIVYNLLHTSDDLDSVEYSSDDEKLEGHPLLKEFCKKKEKPHYSKIKDKSYEPYEPSHHPIDISPPLNRQSLKLVNQPESTDASDINNNNFAMKKNDELCIDVEFLEAEFMTDKAIKTEKQTKKVNDSGMKNGNRNEETQERTRQQQLIRQIPPHDFDSSYCHEPDAYEMEELLLFSKQVQEDAVGKATLKTNNLEENMKCIFCSLPIPPRLPYKFTEQLPDKAWHPKCFKCSLCKEVLVDDIYFRNNQNIYCGRHYAEIFKVRCTACDELIFSREFTQAEDKNWHKKHFCCYKCEKRLGGHTYVAVKSKPYCVPCYHENVADRCLSCGLPIQVGSERINYDQMNWHVASTCFCCYACQKSLVDLQFLPKEGKIFCSRQCSER